MASKMRLMNLLAIETSTDVGSIAVCRDGEVRRWSCPPQFPHSQTLLPMIKDALTDAGLVVTDLDAIAFAAGPGAFTSLRVACAVAQGLAFAAQLPLIPIGTLDAMATLTGGDRVIVALDARMGEVYYGLFDHHRPRFPVTVCDPATVEVPASSGWLGCGNGFAAYPQLRARLAGVMSHCQSTLMPDACAVARLAALRLARGETSDVADATPVYIRDKVALTVAERCQAGGKA